MNLIFLPDGTVYDVDKRRIVLFTVEQFENKIVLGNNCFICGASPNDATFNAEHVIPDWILRRYNLHSRQITLPNNARMLYGQYTVPCCSDCNSLMAEKYERPISKLVSQGYSAVTEHFQKHGPELLFTWMARIFLKTHLKDRELRYHLDSRKADFKIADLHKWRDFYHLHCISRAFYTGARIAPEVFGSVIILQMDDNVYRKIEPFNFADLTEAQSIMLQLEDICLICVLNDSRAAKIILQEDYLDKIPNSVSYLQAEELFANAAFVNIRLKNRPVYKSSFLCGDYSIIADLEGEGPEVIDATRLGNRLLLGSLMYKAMSRTLTCIHAPAEIHEYVRQGRYTYLFDDNENFITNSLVVEEINKPSK